MGVGAGLQAGGSALSLLEAKNQADALKLQSQFDAQQAEFNSQLIGMQKNDLERQSVEDVKTRNRNLKQILGKQKVSLAAQGIKVDSDLAQDLEDSERGIAAEDVEIIKNNAWRQVMGLEIQQSDILNQARSTREQGKTAARNTLVSGGLSAVSGLLGAFGGSR